MTAIKNKAIIRVIRALGAATFLCVILIGIAIIIFEKQYENRIYPNVSIGGIQFGGKSKSDVIHYWSERNAPLQSAMFELTFESQTATISGDDIDLGFDAELSALHAYLVGRSNGFITNIYQKFFARQVTLNPYFRWRDEPIDEAIRILAEQIDIPVTDALFQFENGKVAAFKPSSDGRKLNQELTKTYIAQAFQKAVDTNVQRITVQLPVETIQPKVSTQNANSYGIKELIGKGYSEFAGSIPGRIHNVVLAASRINGILIPPQAIFSFNAALGDISAATGYQSAYIIKDGRTVLGDGGGVCQVSSTFFRAALDAGLPIIDRRAHAYRVHFYEDGGFKPGLDATVFSPSVDLKIQNDTPGYILIQAKPDTKNLTLTFEFYGTRDGRKAEILNHVVSSQTPPPPPLYQDDPTLKAGVVKQVDWAAWGAKTSFQYKVTREGQVLQDKIFTSNFRPWQAVYLKGTQP